MAVLKPEPSPFFSEACTPLNFGNQAKKKNYHVLVIDTATARCRSWGRDCRCPLERTFEQKVQTDIV